MTVLPADAGKAIFVIHFLGVPVPVSGMDFFSRQLDGRLGNVLMDVTVLHPPEPLAFILFFSWLFPHFTGVFLFDFVEDIDV